MHLFLMRLLQASSCSLPLALAKEVLMKRAGKVCWSSANILRSKGLLKGIMAFKGSRGRLHDLLDWDKIKDDVGCRDDSKGSHEDGSQELDSFSYYVGNGRCFFFFLRGYVLPDLMLPSWFDVTFVWEILPDETMGANFGAGLCEDLCAFSCGAWCLSLQLTIWSVEGSSLGCGMATLLARIHVHFTGIQWINMDKPW